jgi:hypothetical protein
MAVEHAAQHERGPSTSLFVGVADNQIQPEPMQPAITSRRAPIIGCTVPEQGQRVRRQELSIDAHLRHGAESIVHVLDQALSIPNRLDGVISDLEGLEPRIVAAVCRPLGASAPEGLFEHHMGV